MPRTKKGKGGVAAAAAAPVSASSALDAIPEAMTGVTVTAGSTVDASVLAASVAASTKTSSGNRSSDGPYDSLAALRDDGIPAPSYMKLNKAKLDEILVLNPVAKFGKAKRVKVGAEYSAAEKTTFGGRYNGKYNGERNAGDRLSFWSPWIKASPKAKEMRDNNGVLKRQWTWRLNVSQCYDYVSLKRVNFHQWLIETLHDAVLDKLCDDKTKYGLTEGDSKTDVHRMFGKNDSGPVKNVGGDSQIVLKLSTDATFKTPKGTVTDETNTSLDQITPYLHIIPFDGGDPIDPRAIFGQLAVDNKTGEPLISKYDGGRPYMVTHDSLRDFDYVKVRIYVDALSLYSNDEKLSYQFVAESIQVATEAQLLARNRISLPVSDITAGDDDDDVYASIIDDMVTNGELDEVFAATDAMTTSTANLHDDGESPTKVQRVG